MVLTGSDGMLEIKSRLIVHKEKCSAHYTIALTLKYKFLKVRFLETKKIKVVIQSLDWEKKRKSGK